MATTDPKLIQKFGCDSRNQRKGDFGTCYYFYTCAKKAFEHGFIHEEKTQFVLGFVLAGHSYTQQKDSNLKHPPVNPQTN